MCALSDQRKIFDELKDRDYRHSFLDAWVKSNIAMQIRGLRKKMGKDQKQFAKLMGTGQSAISRAEQYDYGRMGMEFLLKLAKAFDTALIIEFASYEEFLERLDQFSEGTLKVPSFDETKWPWAVLHRAQSESAEIRAVRAVGDDFCVRSGKISDSKQKRPRWSSSAARANGGNQYNVTQT